MSERPKRVGIVGAGLAGLLSALWIKEGNPKIDIEIFERRKLENYRIDCGEALLDQRKAFERVGKIAEPFIKNKLKRVHWRMELDGELRTATIYYPKPPCWIVDRLSWQRKIMEELRIRGVKINFGERVDPSDLSEFDLVVDARGSLSKEHFASGVYGIYSGKFDSIVDTTVSEIRKSIYYWIFPIDRNHANIGCGMFRNFVKRKFLTDYLSELEFEVGEELKRGAGLVDFSYGVKLSKEEGKIVTERGDGGSLVRIGDAAGLADPLTGEGMTGAISSAYWLSYSISKGGDYLSSYERLLRAENEFLTKNMEAMEARIKYYDEFVRFMTLLDGVNGRYLNSRLFLLRYPIRALKLKFM
jgi:digeranylgeranylglycerophospholipid reductase